MAGRRPQQGDQPPSESSLESRGSVVSPWSHTSRAQALVPLLVSFLIWGPEVRQGFWQPHTLAHHPPRVIHVPHASPTCSGRVHSLQPSPPT